MLLILLRSVDYQSQHKLNTTTQLCIKLQYTMSDRHSFVSPSAEFFIDYLLNTPPISPGDSLKTNFAITSTHRQQSINNYECKQCAADGIKYISPRNKRKWYEQRYGYAFTVHNQSTRNCTSQSKFNTQQL